MNVFFCKGNRGSVIFVKDGIDVTIHKQLNNLSPKEAVWCEINITNNKKVLVGLVYRSPNSTENNNLLLNDLIKQIGNYPFAYKVIMGDFNYRTINWTNWISEAPPGHISHELIECIRDSFLHQHVQNDTRFRGSVRPSNLDLVFSNDELLIEDLLFLSPIGKSDHLTLTFKLLCDINEKINPTYESNSYLYHKGDYESMKRHLNSLNWDLEFNEKN